MHSESNIQQAWQLLGEVLGYGLIIGFGVAFLCAFVAVSFTLMDFVMIFFKTLSEPVLTCWQRVVDGWAEKLEKLFTSTETPGNDIRQFQESIAKLEDATKAADEHIKHAQERIRGLEEDMKRSEGKHSVFPRPCHSSRAARATPGLLGYFC
jgi:septal ring factor EnvC (AmiA/AmiB activator)